MAGDWIKVDHTTPDKPEVFRMAEKLGVDSDAIVGKLVRFWSWCDQQTIDGNSFEVSDYVIDRVTHQPGFSAALREVSWLQARSGSLAIPNFDRHNGQTAKARALANRRKSVERDKRHAESVTKTGTREEKRREEGIQTPKPPSPPAQADARHSEITRRWGPAYASAFDMKYMFATKDASTLKRFLRVNTDSADTILGIASEAWARSCVDRFAKRCKEAASIHGLCTYYNEIRVELQSPEFSAIDKTQAGWNTK